MLATSELIIYGDYEVVMQGTSVLTADAFFSPEATMDGASEFWATANGVGYGYGASLLQAIGGRGGIDDPGHGDGTAELPALMQVSGSGGFVVPTATTIGIATLPKIGGSGVVITSKAGGGAAEIPALTGLGSDYVFGHGAAMLPELTSFGMYGLPNTEANMIDYAFIGTASANVPVLSVVFISDGTVTSVGAFTRMQVVELLSQVDCSSTLGGVGIFVQALISSITALSQTAANIVTGGNVHPDLDGTSRVWVVNIETGQSSQYDDYGFSDYFDHYGVPCGLANDGIYRLDGDDDVGFDIESFIDFGESYCGLPGRKKILNVHVGTSSAEEMYLKVDTDTGSQTYQLVASERGATDYRAKLVHNLQGSYWNFTLTAVNDYELDGVDFRPAKLSRRL